MGKSADPFYTVATELSRTRGNALFICLFVAMCFLSYAFQLAYTGLLWVIQHTEVWNFRQIVVSLTSYRRPLAHLERWLYLLIKMNRH